MTSEDSQTDASSIPQLITAQASAAPDALMLRKAHAELGQIMGARWSRPRDTTFDRYFRAVMGYLPRAFPGRIVLFWPADEPTLHPGDPTMGWGRVAQVVEVHTVPGTHNSIVTRHIQAIGERLATYL